MDLKERYELMKNEGFETDRILYDSFAYSEGFYICQGVALLSDKFVGLRHFLRYEDAKLKEFLEEMRLRSNNEIGFVVISGYKKEHDLWVRNLEEQKCTKLAEFTDDFGNKDDDYVKGLAIGPREAILQLKHGRKNQREERYIKLV